MGKVGRTISFDSYLIAEFDKRGIDLNDLINRLLAEHLAILQIKEKEVREKIRTQTYP